MESQRLWTKSFISICLSSFFIFITFYCQTATLPTFVTDNLGESQSLAGWVLTVYVIAGVLMRPFAGRWMVGPHRSKVLILSLIGFMAVSLFYPLVSSFGFLLVLRALQGVSFGAATTGNGTIVAEIVPTQRKGEGLGYYTLSFNLAMVLGPFVGLLVIQNANFNVLFYILIACGVLGLALGWSTARIPKPSTEEGSVHKQEKLTFKSLFEVGAIPISITALLLAIAYSGILSYVPTYAKEIGLSSISSYYFVVYAIIMVLARPFTGRMFDKLPRNMLVYPTLLLYAGGLVVLASANSAFTFLLSAGIIGLGYGSLFPCLQAIAVQSVPRERVGLATSTFFIFFDSGVGIGSVLLGSVASATSNRTMYLAAAAIVALAAIVYFALLHRNAAPKPQAAKNA
ncbi:MFS transporter [Cohnella lubricantis]|uniref:MFS transporter n=1 Tax=Cohnella lubricantis TaxID=2163172 RepID=UPI001FD8B623|nr:MFS transporter [Cohnella lubricantis]MBP2118372.1 MFS family permease [Cohnella lubricantis]